MTRKTIIALTTATVIGIGALTAGAAAWAKGNHGDRIANHVTKFLDLDSGQTEAFKALQAEMMETRELMQMGKGSFSETMTTLVSEDTFNQQLALETINDRVTAFQSNAPDLVNAAAVFFDGLSADQKAELMEKMSKMQERHSGRHSRH